MPATQGEIDTLISEIQNALYEGDRAAGTTNTAALEEITKRKNELAKKKQDLVAEVKRKEAIIEMNNQDFSDIKKSTPDPIPTYRANVIEDYTLLFLLVSYLFMVIIAISIYVLAAETGKKIQALVTALGYAFGASLVLFVFGYLFL